MPFSPCGYMVDFIRCAHEEDCKFFTDSDRVDRVAFVEVPWDTPAFPGVSIIYPAIMDSSAWPFPESMVGCRRPERVEFTGAKAPKGLFTGHFCGSFEEHEQGAKFKGAVVRVAADGWPRCCNPPFRVGGGAGAGAASDFSIDTGITPSNNCATATPIPLDVPTLVNVPASGGPYFVVGTPGVAPLNSSVRITSYTNGGSWLPVTAFPNMCTVQTSAAALTGVGCRTLIDSGSPRVVGAIITPGGTAGQVVVNLSNSAC